MDTRHRPGRRGSGGFSLIEISLVLIIAGLALGGLLAVLGPQLEQRKYSETQRQLKDASEALLAFAMVNRRLPCPATAGSNGRESFCTNAIGGCGAEIFSPAIPTIGQRRGRCFAAPNAGFVPAVTLGLSALSAAGTLTDAWAGAIRYRVTDVANTTNNNSAVTLADGACSVASPCYPYTQAEGIRNAWYIAGPPPSSSGTPTSQVFTCRTATGLAAGNCGAALQLANPAFVVYSYARNGNTGTLGVDEAANVNADSVYVLHEKSEPAAPNGAFDDLFEWATIPQLIARMQGNGVLP